SFEGDDFVDGVFVSEVGDVDVFVTAKGEKRIGGRGVSDQRGIGRPGEPSDVEFFVVCDLPRFHRKEIRLGRGDIDGPNLALLVVFFEDFVVAVLLFPVFVFFRFFGRGGECDLLAVLRPIEILDIGFVAGELPRFAAIGRDQPNLVSGGFTALVAGFCVLLVLIFVGLVAVLLLIFLIIFLIVFLIGRCVVLFFFVRRNNRALFALGSERDPLAIGRPAESLDRLLAACQLKGHAGRHVHNPKLANVEVVFPIGLAHGVRDVAPIGRNL